jgi:hypothetical protein
VGIRTLRLLWLMNYFLCFRFVIMFTLCFMMGKAHGLEIVVWTPCLMHRCVCIWRYILQNYNYKLHFQNLFICDIPHASMGTLATENLDVCTACDPSPVSWPLEQTDHDGMNGWQDRWLKWCFTSQRPLICVM